jgi:hypothetical protein
MKWGRWHHHVDYSPFKQQLIKKEGLVIPKGNNEYGMSLRRATDAEVAAGDKFFE